MSDQKISDLTSYTPAVDTDVVPIVDTTTATTKKITWANIKSTLFNAPIFSGLAKFPYTIAGGFAMYDTNSSNLLGIKIGSDLTSDRILTITTGDSNRTLTMTGDASISGTNTGDIVKATGAEVDTGTDDAKFVTAKAMEDSSYIKSGVCLPLSGGTMTGTITLGENTGIALDPAGSADGKWSGITITGTAGYAQTYGDLVYLAVADSRWEKTDADSTTTAYGLVGMVVVAGAADGNACTILLQGQIRADAAFPALTVGAPVYLGETAGAIQTTIPTGADNVIRVVGFALTADEIYFNPSQDVQLTVA